MANDGNDDDFGKELAAAFDADESQADTKPVEPPKDDDTATPPAAETAPKPGEESKPNESATPEVPKEGESATPPASDEKKPEDGTTPPKAPETPPAEDKPAPQPLTKDDVTSIIQNLRTEERTSGQALDTTTKEVLDAYYPDGLSNTLVDEATGRELRTPQDVVDASGGEMTTEQAAQWLMNKQYELDQNVAKIKDEAKNIAETTLNFKRDSMAVLQKYEPLFKAYPHLQTKAFNLMMKQVKADDKKGVILAAPDVMDLYDTYLEPYQQAFEFSTQQSATNPTPPAPGAAATPPPATPGVNDRLDEGGDGGVSPVDDPNDFAQQVSKELTRGL